jgi:hypothetical protein
MTDTREMLDASPSGVALGVLENQAFEELKKLADG